MRSPHSSTRERPYTATNTAAAKSLQSCPTLCDPIDGSLPGSPIPGILQARALEWGAIAFSDTATKTLDNPGCSAEQRCVGTAAFPRLSTRGQQSSSTASSLPKGLRPPSAQQSDPHRRHLSPQSSSLSTPPTPDSSTSAIQPGVGPLHTTRNYSSFRSSVCVPWKLWPHQTPKEKEGGSLSPGVTHDPFPAPQSFSGGFRWG